VECLDKAQRVAQRFLSNAAPELDPQLSHQRGNNFGFALYRVKRIFPILRRSLFSSLGR
jgi:hypothetical protein